MRVDGGGGDLAEEIHRRGQPRDAVAVERAALEPRRIFLRLFAPVGLHARAAGLERADLHAGRGDEPAGPLRPHHALMPGEAEDGNAVALRVQVKAARRLRGVEDEQKAVFARKSADAGCVQRVAGEIGGVRADDRAGVRPQRAGEIGIIDAAAHIGAQERDLHALILQPVERAEHAVVLEIGRNHVVAGPEKPENGSVERLGRVLREAHARRVRPAEKGAELFARGVYHARGGKRALARAAADVAQRAQRLAHRAHHALRTAERCGGVVEIDHKKPSRRYYPQEGSTFALFRQEIR